MDVKCKRCRKNVFNGEIVQLLTAHSELKANRNDTDCAGAGPDCCVYICVENMPKSLEQTVNQESWTKGRIHCQQCKNRIGSFNFIHEMKCNCGFHTIPPIKIIISKVDLDTPIEV